MTPVEVLWAQFLPLKSLCFLSRSKKADGWSGVGTGEVITAQPSVGVLTFTEAGLWQPDQGREVPFTKVRAGSPPLLISAAMIATRLS